MNQFPDPPYWDQQHQSHSTYPQEFMDHYRKPLKPRHGILVFVIVILLSIFVAAPIQYFFGMLGLALTELMLLAVAVVSALLFRQDLREVFPIHRPRLKPFFATLLTWVGCYMVVLFSTMILIYLFPEGFLDVSKSMDRIFSTTPHPVTLLIVAIMPAICEEAVHRGFIQYTFRNIRNPFVAVTGIGIIFGIFHLDPYRFLPMTLLGMGLAYVMLRTRNLLYPALFHFINNSLSVLASNRGSGGGDLPASYYTGPMMLMSIGLYLILSAVVPFLFLWVHCLLRRPGEPKKSLTLPAILCALLTALMIIIGFALLIFTSVNVEDWDELIRETENLLVLWVPRYL